MTRKILGIALIIVSGVLLLLSAAGIIAAWVYNEPVTQRAVTQLQTLDGELANADVALGGAATELTRALRILDSAQTALESLSQNTTKAQDALQAVGDTLDEKVIPGLNSTRDGLDQVRGTLENARSTLESINNLSILPAPIPGDAWLSGLLQATDSLSAQIDTVQTLAGQASTFVADVGYVLGGDFGETRAGLTQLLDTVTDYQGRIAGWRAQIAATIAALPGVVDRICIVLTLLLFWFGLSQGGLILHGLTLYRGRDPLTVARRRADSGEG
jgi:uncharacterized phage infection (PIP) family protein YhgE